MIGIYNHVWMSPYNIEHITEFEIQKRMGKHDRAYIKGVISETSLALIQNMIDGKTIVSVCFEQEQQTQLLFAGYISKVDVTEVGIDVQIRVELEGLTQALDRAEVFLDYQDISKTNVSVIEEVMKSYPDISYEISCKQETIDSLLLQYEETDYEFATRLLSQVEAPIYTVMQGDKGKLSFGLRVRDSQCVLDEAEFEVFYADGLQYRLVHDEFWDIGMQVTMEGQALVVKSAKYSYLNGESINTYQLGTIDSCHTKIIRNDKVTGISLDGIIVECKRDKVKIELNKTLPCEDEKRKWFAYSSPAASSDGSGWYCMPKKGEEIRLYCPTNDEREAYVISAIREGQTAQQTHQPVDKVWSNTAGQEIDFTENGISLNSNSGAVSMDIKQDGTIEIIANKNLEIYAEQDIMLKANKGMSIISTKGVTLSNDTGSLLAIDNDITEEANRIRNNC